MADECRLVQQGFSPGSCAVWNKGKRELACKATLRWEDGVPQRLTRVAHLSRPEHYFSIYGSGCNFTCKKCHSWEFTQFAEGGWLSPQDIAAMARTYAQDVTYREPRERATAYHAIDLCRGCGTCVEVQAVTMPDGSEAPFLQPTGKRSPQCPGKLTPEQLILGPQGFGPARNIVSFSGGDLMCQPEYYAMATQQIKAQDLGLWVLLESNGYGLTPQNLDMLAGAGVDSFWLDIKAFDPEVHRRLTGAAIDPVLRAPEEILKRGFVLEVLSLVIPGWVEADQIGGIARHLASLDVNIPFSLIAFFPQYEMEDVPSPDLDMMLLAYQEARAAGLKNVRLGNIGFFVESDEDYDKLLRLAPEAI